MKDPHDIRKAAIEDEIIARSEKASSKLSCFKCGDGSTPLYCLNCANDELQSKCERLEGELTGITGQLKAVLEREKEARWLIDNIFKMRYEPWIQRRDQWLKGQP